MTYSAGWTATRLKYVVSANGSSLPDSTPADTQFTYVDIGGVSQGEMTLDSEPIMFGEAPSRARRLAAPGDVVVSTVRTYLRAVAQVPETDRDLVFSTGFAVLHPHRDVDQGWLAYALQADTFVDQVIANSDGISYPAINATKLMSLRIDLPPLPTQHAIADFLDRETAQIDELIAEQERLIGLLRERRAARRELLATRVAKGSRIKTWLREVDRRAGWRADSLPLLSVSIDWGVRRRDEVTSDLARAEDLGNYKVARQGELVLNRMRAFQGSLGIAPEDGIVSPDYAVFALPPEYTPQWLAAVMKTTAFLDEIRIRLRGIGNTDSGKVRTPRINAADFVGIRLEVGSPASQRRELAELELDISKIDALIAEAEHNVALSKERRAALITEAVTGRVDIEDYAS